ncbi:MAG TPA: ATP-binding protein [Verrucomicrobiae bacterium]|nr:ATP-binding protein [Verrucomicrobiae bacterium]
MTGKLLTNLTLLVDAAFTPVRLRVALVLALVGAWIVCSVFVYLSRYTHKSYFRFWAAGWMYYSTYLVALIGLGEQLDRPVVVMLREACIGVGALSMFWGSLQFTGHTRHERELALGMVVMLGWGYLVAYQLQGRTWITIPMFSLLALAGVYTGACHLPQRQKCRSAKLLAAAFLLWSLHLLAFPFQKSIAPAFMMVNYLTAAALTQVIALGMMMFGLEQARERNEAMLVKFKEGVTRRRLLQREIGFSEQKYRALFDSASDAIVLIDLSNFEIVGANEAAAQLAGTEAGNLVGHSLVKLCPQLSSAGHSLLENKRLVEDMLESSGEFPVVRADGGQVLCEGGANLVPYHKRPVLQINARAITERKKMEQQLRQTEKLTALGQLVAGVAHELNNPLAVVMGYAQILCQQPTIEERVRKDLLKILHESDRAAKIVRNLLTFARPREPHMVMVDLNRLVSEALETRDIQLQGAHVQIVRRLASNLPPTMADPGQVEQVLANLVTNAVQALADHPGPHMIEAITGQRNGKLCVTISDNGPGIPPQILSKIFDPFFTTKGPGKGTGLGLSICYSIMEEHKGRIWVESEVGRGSRFFIELPVVACPDQPSVPSGPLEKREVDPEAAQRRLLIVDDEPGIVDVLKEVLGTSGYRIETASNGAEALARIASQHYDLIISDLCMPEMSGERLYRMIGERFPHLQDRIVFVTGDTVSPTSRRFLDETGAPWLSKPFNIREIERLVVTILREEPAVARAP